MVEHRNEQSFAVLGAELVRVASHGNVVNAGGMSINKALFSDAICTQPHMQRKRARFIMPPIVADEYMDYLRCAPGGLKGRDHNKFGDIEFLIVGWLPTDTMLLASPGGIVFRPFSLKRFLTFDNPRCVTLVKNIGRAVVEKTVDDGLRQEQLSTLGPHFVDWMKEKHPDVPLDAVPQSVVTEYYGGTDPSTEGASCYDMSAVKGGE